MLAHRRGQARAVSPPRVLPPRRCPRRAAAAAPDPTAVAGGARAAPGDREVGDLDARAGRRRPKGPIRARGGRGRVDAQRAGAPPLGCHATMRGGGGWTRRQRRWRSQPPPPPPRPARFCPPPPPRHRWRDCHPRRAHAHTGEPRGGARWEPRGEHPAHQGGCAGGTLTATTDRGAGTAPP
ncbi:hypothetical protein BU14_0095s0004 [Porphyra umbilicalis]|uniref:Uncharacterized protein n=1 Tax=Porphyra umbilicalis TaxID=2786 RepID=A0A1X6PDD5_PORUM|nr:hypothetical protein BU14_0095s0004 [Porphyra umbilicalis]|eukprot:OSX78888.1 hypothetical protein BU14_0095s0004 [Porphyra umbilicalis]